VGENSTKPVAQVRSVVTGGVPGDRRKPELIERGVNNKDREDGMDILTNGTTKILTSPSTTTVNSTSNSASVATSSSTILTTEPENEDVEDDDDKEIENENELHSVASSSKSAVSLSPAVSVLEDPFDYSVPELDLDFNGGDGFTFVGIEEVGKEFKNGKGKSKPDVNSSIEEDISQTLGTHSFGGTTYTGLFDPFGDTLSWNASDANQAKSSKDSQASNLVGVDGKDIDGPEGSSTANPVSNGASGGRVSSRFNFARKFARPESALSSSFSDYNLGSNLNPINDSNTSSPYLSAASLSGLSLSGTHSPIGLVTPGSLPPGMPLPSAAYAPLPPPTDEIPLISSHFRKDDEGILRIGGLGNGFSGMGFGNDTLLTNGLGNSNGSASASGKSLAEASFLWSTVANVSSSSNGQGNLTSQTQMQAQGQNQIQAPQGQSQAQGTHQRLELNNMIGKVGLSTNGNISMNGGNMTQFSQQQQQGPIHYQQPQLHDQSSGYANLPNSARSFDSYSQQQQQHWNSYNSQNQSQLSNGPTPPGIANPQNFGPMGMRSGYGGNDLANLLKMASNGNGNVARNGMNMGGSGRTQTIGELLCQVICHR
jgi:hypothetical protein